MNLNAFRKTVVIWNGLILTGFLLSSVSMARGAEQWAAGVVYHDKNADQKFDAADKPLAGMRVSNGLDIVLTDEQGKYRLPVSDDSILFVIQPRGWKSPLNAENLPQFYYIHKPNGSPEGTQYAGVGPTGALPEAINFPLQPTTEPDQYQVILFGDTQPRNQQEVDWVIHDVVEELRGTTAAFGVTLGDVSFDNLDTLAPLNRGIAVLGIPWINVMGNHDVNYDAPRRELANETFESIYGPGYYSFDYGPVHYVVLDDIETLHDPKKKRSSYRGGFGERQLKFVENDLKDVPDDHLVVLLMHIPLPNAEDREAMYRLIENRSHCISFSAHTHRHEHFLIGAEQGWRGKKPHHHINHVTVCGSWWSGARDEREIPHATMSDGGPNGYSFLNINGTEYTVDYRAAGRGENYQMEINAPEVVQLSAPTGSDITVNFFNGSETSQVKMQVGTGDWKTLEQVREPDPKFLRVRDSEETLLGAFQDAPFRKLPKPSPCSHLWKGTLPTDLPVGTHLIKIKATDHWGREFESGRVVRVEQ